MELHSTFSLELKIDNFITKCMFFADVINSSSGHDLVHTSVTDSELI